MMMHPLRWSYGGHFDASTLDVAHCMEVVGHPDDERWVT
jgi:hypothetical protein